MHLMLPAKLAALTKLAAKNEGRFGGATQHLRVTVKDGRYRIEATDGRMLGILHGEAEQFESTTNFDDILLPVDEYNRLGALLKSDDTFRFEAVAQGKFYAHGKNGSATGKFAFQTGVKLADGTLPEPTAGRFPNIESLLGQYAKDGPTVSIKVNAANLIKVLQAAMAVTPEDECHTVMLHIYAKDKPFAVTAKGPTLCFDSLIVPLVDVKEK